MGSNIKKITSLACLSIEDKDAFAAALYRPPNTIWGEHTTDPGLTELGMTDTTHGFNEKKKIALLPDHLLQKQKGLKKLMSRTHPKRYCKLHETLHTYIISSILHKVRREVTGPQFNIFVPLQHPVAESLVTSLKQINAYWTTPSDYLKIFPVIKAPLESGPVFFQENKCDACILVAISGNKEVLEALRTSSFSKRRTGGRLIEWLDRWLFSLGGEVLCEASERSERNAHILRGLKCGLIQKQTAEDKVMGLGDTADTEAEQLPDDYGSLENWEAYED
ncbi:uncharacterized protein LAJ45_03244 [Morchella importuna]|uniref:Uncharacterized protein n=1 Tax=Morchella conica CCBAS932 TaxID=1392247 RepID=A0A3N4KZP5_9PEZI|nr:uncharacterized protein LAJ45_03244 [Morchella importuna]KAH8152404.1 hypothetical protein LAJ45_03244 [Morchella importuna]RPB13811.1 hypothetical protein P167DRAFT_544440 [Morchella conica CCBAS932]